MSIPQNLRATLQKLQSYAAQYFSSLYSSSIIFWAAPPPPTGSNVLTGAFAYFMIYTARSQLSQETDATTMGEIIFYGTVILLSICGILVIFDPLFSQQRLLMWRKLVSTVAIGSILGCIFIVLDAVAPWIDWVFQFANYTQWFSEANLLVAVTAATLAFIVLVVNSIPKMSGGIAQLAGRPVAWSAVILVLLVLTIHQLVTKTYT